VIDYACLQTFSRLYVGLSGGLDSTVLLHLLASKMADLPPIQAIYIHHGISPNATAWQTHCETFCQSLAIPLITKKIAFNRACNLEEAARKARYAALADEVQASEALLTGHHADDQAETLVLQLMRGAGVDGLSAMKKHSPFAAGALVRPLLAISRRELENYATRHALVWIEDESNLDNHYARNFLRNIIFPALRDKWPATNNVLNRTAQLAQDAKVCLDDLAMLDMGSFAEFDQLPFRLLTELSRERVLNCLRFWIKKQVHILPSAATLTRIYTEVIQSREDATPAVSFGNHIVRRFNQRLYLEPVLQSLQAVVIPWTHFPERCEPGEAFGVFEGTGKAENVEIRFRQGGEVLRLHGQTKSLKKLFQQWKIPPWKRESIPLIYIAGQLAVVVGYARSDDFPDIEVRCNGSTS
jgi:tRNA(Ile)-lysidine synthase